MDNRKGFFQLISSRQFGHLFEQFAELDIENVQLDRALHRFLAKDIVAPENLPPFSRSTMDGYAVRARDTFGCSESEPLLLNVIGEIAMGTSGQNYSLQRGAAATIWTGGELPQNADAVLMVEYSNHLDSETIEVCRAVAPGENVIQAGDDFLKNSAVLEKGQCLRPQDLGALAGLGITTIPAFKKPRVAIISTGDELVDPERDIAPGEIRDINTTTLAALVTEAGGIPFALGIIKDDFEVMLAECRRVLAGEVDILLLSGGSSVGQRDFTLSVFNEIEDVNVLAHGVAIRPGKPTIFGQKDNSALFGLPGHVASAIVVFYLFVRPLMRVMSGTADSGLQTTMALTGAQVPSAIGREEYVRVRLLPGEEGQLPEAFPVYGKSGLLKPLISADGFLKIARDCEGLDKGDLAEVILFPR